MEFVANVQKNAAVVQDYLKTFTPSFHCISLDSGNPLDTITDFVLHKLSNSNTLPDVT
jgi:hypothetical protein